MSPKQFWETSRGTEECFAAPNFSACLCQRTTSANFIGGGPGPRVRTPQAVQGRRGRDRRELRRPTQTRPRRRRKDDRLRHLQTRRTGLHRDRARLLEEDASSGNSRQNQAGRGCPLRRLAWLRRVGRRGVREASSDRAREGPVRTRQATHQRHRELLGLRQATADKFNGLPRHTFYLRLRRRSTGSIIGVVTSTPRS